MKRPEIKQIIKEEFLKLVLEGKEVKPDFPDLDKDGDKEESIKKAAKDAKKQVKEGGDNVTENYMFFSNLKQMHRQIELLMEINPEIIEMILQNGHDWADDHIIVAKENMDQVFDFIMNKTK